MRKFIISAAVAAVAAISFAAPSHAGGYGHYGHHRHHGHYHGGVSVTYYGGGYYGGGSYEPACYIKKVKRWDRWGNLRIKRIRICD